MATLSTGTLSADLRDTNGYYFEGQTIASTPVLTSSAIVDGGALGDTEIVGLVASTGALAADTALKIELKSSATEAGPYATFDTPYNETGESAISGVAEISTIVSVEDTAGSLNNTSIYLSSPTTDYYIWFNINSAGTDPAITGRTAIPVLGATNVSANDLATAITAAVDALADFGAGATTATTTITNATTGACTAIADVDTTWTVDTTTSGVTADAGGLTLTAEDELFRVIVPTNANPFIQAVVTSAAGNSGTIDIFDLSVAG